MDNLIITVGGGATATAPESYIVCDSCGADDELKEWVGIDGLTYHSCKPCWFDIQESNEEIHYNRCASCFQGDATHRYLQDDGTYLEVCEGCFLLDETEFLEPPPKRQALQCNDCKKNPATETFNHLDGRTFDLCKYCWQLADHEEDYGADFGSVPNLRKSGPAKFCECPLPCDFTISTRCDLCSGVVLVGSF
jgi:hypothetical protein